MSDTYDKLASVKLTPQCEKLLDAIADTALMPVSRAALANQAILLGVPTLRKIIPTKPKKGNGK